MKVRAIKKTKPRPQIYIIGVSVKVPEYMGPFGFMNDTVRLNIQGSCQTGLPDHRMCMARIRAAREAYIANSKPESTHDH